MCVTTNYIVCCTLPNNNIHTVYCLWRQFLILNNIQLSCPQYVSIVCTCSMSWDRCYDHPREKFERPPGGLRTLEDVWTEALALPIFMDCCWEGTVVEETGSFWTLATVCWRLSAAFVCGSGGLLVGGWAAGLVVGGSLPKNIELPPPGGRRTLATSTQELTNNMK